MNQFLAKDQHFEVGSSFEIRGQEAIHISKVLRKQVGDSIVVANGIGYRAKGTIQSITKKAVFFQVDDIEYSSQERRIILILGLLHNKSRLEFAVEKAVELGVTQIILFSANHSDFNKINEDRVQSYIDSAVKQSLRSWIPILSICKDFRHAIHETKVENILIFHEKSDILPNYAQLSNQDVAFVIGPEGGLSNDEMSIAEELGFPILSLGSSRLRSETAVITALSRLTQ